LCGILGILKTGSGKIIKSEIETLLPYIDHRGPDAWGSYAAPGIGLGHSRLSIIDVNNGHQPMVSPYSSLSFNGEIFNYIELRKELESLGNTFDTSSDTEVVQKSIETWGTDAFSRFNGQFAILFWDKKKKKLLAARDRYGIRPLYYLLEGKNTYFSSELKVFDHLENRKRYWSPDRLLDHGLVWNTLGNETLFDHIYSLEGGHYQIFTENTIYPSQSYYVLGEESLHIDNSHLTFDEQVKIFREKLKESVRLRLRSDVPIGCYLSGGIDSSVTSLLAKEINNQSFKSFSVTFTDPSLDESKYQKMMVDSLNYDHHYLEIDGPTIEKNFFNAAKHFERPVFRSAPVPLYLLSEKVRQNNVKVVLTGEAADEILFGYDTNKELQLLSQWKKGLEDNEIKNVLLQLNPHLDHYKDSDQVGFLKMYYEGFLDRFEGPLAGLVMRVNNNQILANMFNKEWGISFDFENFSNKIFSITPDHVKSWSLLKRNQYLEMKTLLPGYLLSAQGDRMAMAHGVEGRFPFLDHNLIEWLLTLPDSSKLNGYTPKHLLKEAFKNQIPEPILKRPKRPYMAPDLASFFPEGKKGFLVEEFLNTDIIKQFGLYDPKMIERFIYKIERRGIESAGYRDNMLISFILSNQIIEYQIRNTEIKVKKLEKQTINILE
jgi:asparagine synthase (glutamine-hydrolysing)